MGSNRQAIYLKDEDKQRIKEVSEMLGGTTPISIMYRQAMKIYHQHLLRRNRG